MKLLKMSNFTFFHNVFYVICILNPLIATFQLSSAASLNLGRSQNGVLGNGLRLCNPRRPGIDCGFFTILMLLHVTLLYFFLNILYFFLDKKDFMFP